MTTDIFIRSYARDFPWLAYCLKSINKFCSGFGNIIVVVPEQDRKAIEGFNLTREKVFYVKETGKDSYLFQQAAKVHADLYSQADYVLYTDSDTCFNVPTTPASFFFDDKPVMLITPYHELGKAVPWKPITEKALQFECPFETMRRLPWIYPRALLPLFREYMQKIHGKPVEEYIMEQPHHAFSEFNAMGSFAHQFHPDAFHYIETNKQALPPTVLKQNWSWGGITPEIRKELEEITR